MIWSQSHDTRISSLSAEGKSNQDIAKIVTAEFGTIVSSESVRKRLIRIRDNAALAEALPVVIETEQLFIDDGPPDEYIGLRLAFYDIEASDLRAFMGKMLCVSVADSWGNVTTRRVTDFPQTSVLDDSGLAEWTRDTLATYDVLVAWNGFGYDLPFINARLMKAGKRPMEAKMGIDPMWKAKGNRYGARIGSARLDNVAKYFKIPESKTQISWDVWQLAEAGDEAALDEVVSHCEADVLVLRRVFGHLKPLLRTIHT